MSGPLSGQLIVNTRPLHQQQGLSDLLTAEGAEVISCPAIEIVMSPESAAQDQLAENLADYQVLIFVSANAVEYAFRHLRAELFPEHLQIAAIGEGTARCLETHLPGRMDQLIRGQTSNSEGLLQTAALQEVNGARVMIVRGQSGRNLLGDELQRRGAVVDYCEVYRRQAPARLCDALLADGVAPTLLIFTSNEGMNNFVGLLPGHIKPMLLALPWLLISERMRESARQLGHNAEIIIAGEASETGILRSVCEWVSLKKTKS